MEDVSGQPRSTEEIKEAIQIVEKYIVTGMLKLPVDLAINLTTIRGGLIELVERRLKDVG